VKNDRKNLIQIRSLSNEGGKGETAAIRNNIYSKYRLGYRYCTTCDRWYPPEYLLIRCKDCNRLLRIKPQGKYKEAFDLGRNIRY
jgi:hypothetical protein